MKTLIVGSLLCAGLLAACSRDAKKTDPALASDLALASQVQPAQPQFQDTTQSSTTPANQQRAPGRIDAAPRTRVTPRQVPLGQTGSAAAPAAVARTIAAGSTFSLASQQRICTATNRPGDRFVATLTSPVVGSNGAVVPAGSSVVLEVASASSGSSSEVPTMTLRVHSVEFNGMSYPMNGDVSTQSELERDRIMSDPNADKKKVIGGAVAGAILGQIIGKSTKGTVIGAAAGAATGAVAAKAGEKWQGCLPVGGTMRLTLTQALPL
jgi:hypothetical protein